MSKEIIRKTLPGALMLMLAVVWVAVAVYLFILGVQPPKSVALILTGVFAFLLFAVFASGFYVVQPNEAAVLVLFGTYKGTVKNNGFWWTNPFTKRTRISLRARNLNSEKLKVNDLSGNPIEIATVVVWRVDNTAQASFDVENYREYVSIQCESALRHIASKYPYDEHKEGEISLRGGIEQVGKALKEELQDRLQRAGVIVDETRLSHLAYAPEIAGAMLQRQQASAIVAARQKIVEGAVGMVEMALTLLNEKHVVELDEERKAAMVSNLLVVLCSHAPASPVVNAGTLHH
jgi:regulator of protease activity HflC (stomatin/prohibitin superfamily)